VRAGSTELVRIVWTGGSLRPPVAAISVVVKNSLKAVVPAVAALALSAHVAGAATAGDPAVAASQVALQAKGYYGGPVDGIDGRATVRALRRLQSAHGLSADGVLGHRTAHFLGVFVPRRLGARLLRMKRVGWDVAELQFSLAWHGFPSGRFDGRFGAHLDGALRRFQTFAGLTPDGVAGRATLAALRSRPPAVPFRLRRPLSAPVGDRFGPRGDRFHAGADFPAPMGAAVGAAAAGRVAWVGVRSGWGLVVTLAHGDGVRTMYAHLSWSSVRLGQRVTAGAPVGLVGATGDATGPHLHFEVRVRGAAVDPLPALR
jgi:murein DD-endopeptidase MepM/ murein hydrolase activator NlpD